MKVKVLLKYLNKWRWRRGEIKREGDVNKLYVYKRFLKRKVYETVLPDDLDNVLFHGRSAFLVIDADKNRIASFVESPTYPDDETVKTVAKFMARVHKAMYEEEAWNRAKKFLIIVSLTFAISIVFLLVFQYLQYQQFFDFFKQFLPAPPAGAPAGGG